MVTVGVLGRILFQETIQGLVVPTLTEHNGVSVTDRRIGSTDHKVCLSALLFKLIPMACTLTCIESRTVVESPGDPRPIDEKRGECRSDSYDNNRVKMSIPLVPYQLSSLMVLNLDSDRPRFRVCHDLYIRRGTFGLR